MKHILVDASMQICALFVFGRNALDMRKFGLDFRARPSKWRQITSVMGQGVYVCMYVYVCVCMCVCTCLCACVCLCMCTHARTCVYAFFCLCRVTDQDNGQSTLIVVTINVMHCTVYITIITIVHVSCRFNDNMVYAMC